MIAFPGRRGLNALGFVACVGMMGFALYAQYVMLLEPCPLCVLQRIAVIGLGIVFLGAALHGPAGAGRFAYSAAVLIFASSGAGIAGWHWRMQNLPASEVPACGPGLGYMLDNFPLGQALKMMFDGSGECADVVWSFLGLSMPAWVFICMTILGIAGIWNNLRQ